MLLSRRATYVASPGHAITEQFNDLSSKFLDALEVTKYAAGYLGRGKKTPVTQAHWDLLTSVKDCSAECLGSMVSFYVLLC